MHARLLLSGFLAASLSLCLISTVEAQYGHGGYGVAANPHCAYCGTGHCGWRAPCWKNTHAHLGQYWSGHAQNCCCGCGGGWGKHGGWPDWHCGRGWGLGKWFGGCCGGPHGCDYGYDDHGHDYGYDYGAAHEHYAPGPVAEPTPPPPPLPPSVGAPTSAALRGPRLR
jgi:hypothetical protein